MKVLHLEKSDEGFSVKLVRNLKDVFVVKSEPYEYFISEEWYLVGLSENRSHFAGWSLDSGLLQWRMKPGCLSETWTKWTETYLSNHKKQQTSSQLIGKEITKSEILLDGGKYDYLPSSDESVAENTYSNDLQNEPQQNSEALKINRFLLSTSNEVLVASFSCPYLCVFSPETKKHLATLDAAGNNEIVLDLGLASLSRDGQSIAHASYKEGRFCILLWNLRDMSHKTLELQNEIVDLLVTDQMDIFVYHGSAMGIYFYCCEDKHEGGAALIPNTESKVFEIGRKDTKMLLGIGDNALCVLHGDKANCIGFWSINDNRRLLGHFINDQPVERVVFSASTRRYLVITKQSTKGSFIVLSL
ncbi:hypothetical protein Ciccas_003336 [Cichlidogyrus casuarinus]|uniref:Uncharacterized protein n=1 Tax=Cichlidogyrus casuarinus TaxID=1844966 RepID=A0ABD2QEM5_9PLAT